MLLHFVTDTVNSEELANPGFRVEIDIRGHFPLLNTYPSAQSEATIASKKKLQISVLVAAQDKNSVFTEKLQATIKERGKPQATEA